MIGMKIEVKTEGWSLNFPLYSTIDISHVVASVYHKALVYLEL